MKYLILLVSILSVSERLVAQKHPHEVYLSYGFVKPLTIEFDLGWGYSNSKIEKSTLGPMSVGYRYFFSPVVGVSGQASYIKQKRDVITAGIQTSSSTTTKAAALLVRADIYYVRQPTMKVYSGLGIGMLWEKRSDSQQPYRQPSRNYRSITPHLTAVGIRVGERV